MFAESEHTQAVITRIRGLPSDERLKPCRDIRLCGQRSVGEGELQGFKSGIPEPSEGIVSDVTWCVVRVIYTLQFVTGFSPQELKQGHGIVWCRWKMYRDVMVEKTVLNPFLLRSFSVGIGPLLQ